MKNKGIINTLMVLLLLALLASSALAAPGDKVLFTGDWIKENIAGNTPINDIVFIGDKMYTLFPTRIYQYSLGEEEPRLLVDFMPGEEKSNHYFTTYLQAEEKLGDKARFYVQALFSWKDQLYGLNLLTGQAFLVDVKKGVLYEENPLSLAWDIQEITDALEEGNHVGRDTAGVIEDELFITANISTNMGANQRVYSFDLNTGERKEYKSPFIQRLFSYTEGSFLAVVHDQENSYDYEAQKPIYPKVMVFNPEEDSLSPYLDLPEGEFGGFAYSQEENALFYGADGKIYRQKPQQKQEQAGYIRASHLSPGVAGWVPGPHLYAAGGTYEGVFIKNISPEYMAVEPLTIYGRIGDEARQAFMDKYPDVPLVMAETKEEYYQNQGLSQAIQTGDTGIDVFVVDPRQVNFKKLMEKEYTYPLSGSAVIQNSIHRMYPFIQQAVTHGGEIYGVPIHIEVSTTMAYSADGFTQVGLTQQDVPTTYMEYLELLKRWNEELAEKYPDYRFSEFAMKKSDVMNEAAGKYAHMYIKKGLAIDFDTPLFRKLMAKVEEAFENTEFSSEQEDDEDYRPTLFILHADNALTGDENRPLMLSLDEGEERAEEARASLAFINPGSNNKEMAQAFLEQVVTSYPKAKLPAYYTDEKEPVANEGFDALVAELEEIVRGYKKQLETAEEAEKAELESYIEHDEKTLANKEEYRWIISKKGIENYESFASSFFIGMEEPLYSQKEDSNIYRLLDQYSQGTITLEQFIQEANRRVQMAALENE